MYKAKKFISYMALCVLIFSLCACGEKGSENAAIYGETVGGLEDNELFAIIDTNASLPVLLVTSQVYNDGLGNQAALNCDVYYLIDKEVKNIGTIESMGTAYPIAYDETGIYAACCRYFCHLDFVHERTRSNPNKEKGQKGSSKERLVMIL